MELLQCLRCDSAWRRRIRLDADYQTLTWHFLTILTRKKRGLVEYMAECSVCGQQRLEFLPPGLQALPPPKQEQ